jgi:trigger factor
LEITLDKKNPTEASIRIKLTENDYQSKFDNKVKEYSKKAQLKGFRAGKVPGSVIRKMYGKSILVEEINHILSHSLSDYIKENDLKLIGEPLPDSEKTGAIDWDNQKEFEFEYNIGLIDNFDYSLDKKIKVKSHTINVDKKVIDETVDNLKKQYGKMTNPEVSEAGDSLYGELRAVDGDLKNNGLIDINELATKTIQKKFIGKKSGDVVEFDIEKLLKDENTLSQLTGLTPEEAKSLKGKYEFEIKNVNRVQDAELNQEFFDRLFGKDAVKTKEEFEAKVKETIEDNYSKETQYLLENDIKKTLVDKIKIEVPETFLKDWLKATNEANVTDEDIEKEFDDYVRELKWNLIRNRIAEDNNIEVQHEDVMEKARDMIRAQFGGQMGEELENNIDAFANNYLQAENGENYMKVGNVLRSERTFDVIKEKISVTDKKVSLDEFRKIASA